MEGCRDLKSLIIDPAPRQVSEIRKPEEASERWKLVGAAHAALLLSVFEVWARTVFSCSHRESAVRLKGYFRPDLFIC